MPEITRYFGLEIAGTADPRPIIPLHDVKSRQKEITKIRIVDGNFSGFNGGGGGNH